MHSGKALCLWVLWGGGVSLSPPGLCCDTQQSR